MITSRRSIDRAAVLWAALVLSMIGLVLSGLSMVWAEPDDDPAPTLDEVAVDLVRTANPDTQLSDDVLIRFMRSTCEAFDSGASFDDVLGLIDLAADGDDDVGMTLATATGTATAIYCPAHSDEITTWEP